MWFGWSRPPFLFPVLSVFFLKILGPFQVQHLQSVSPSLSCSRVCFLVVWQNPSICLYFRFFKIFTRRSVGTGKSTKWQVLFFFFFLFIETGSGLLAVIRWSVYVYQSPKEFYASHSLGRILVHAYTICLYSQIWISCTIPSGSPFPPSHS